MKKKIAQLLWQNIPDLTAVQSKSLAERIISLLKESGWAEKSAVHRTPPVERKRKTKYYQCGKCGRFVKVIREDAYMSDYGYWAEYECKKCGVREDSCLK